MFMILLCTIWPLLFLAPNRLVGELQQLRRGFPGLEEPPISVVKQISLNQIGTEDLPV